jgi:hypothetical protein
MTRALRETVDSALGKLHRDDPVLPRTGGPAGNAQLTALIGLVLLVLFLAELVTLIDMHGLISWHIAIGVALVPPSLAKTATTGWRIVRYYAGVRPYRQAGPPPLLLRLLGPLVVGGTLAVLGSGLALIPLGPDAGRRTLFAALGQQVSPLTIHQASFIVWAVATGLHVLARAVPAFGIVTTSGPNGRRPGGTATRGVILLTTLAVAAVAAAILLASSHSWTSGGDYRFHRHSPDSSTQQHVRG